MPEALRLLSDETRWRLIGELRWSDRQVGELCERLDLPQNLVSYHLGILRQARLVRTHRSDADGRVLYYALDLAALQQQWQSVGSALALGHTAPPAVITGPVLFVCTHNSARSQMAEGILRAFSHGAIEAFSAGSQPDEVHPLAIETMDGMNVDIRNQRSKHFDEFLGQHFDVVITVCDRARETCPVFPEAKETIHWSIPDPAAVEDEAEKRRAFHQAATILATRIRYLQILLEREQREQAVMR